jgi:NTP pyrophosphatase (non-canonical NTP hydrolase)
MMTFDDYQEVAVKTAIYPVGDMVIYPALGLCSEAGEVAGKVKKCLRDKNGVMSQEDLEAIADEAGDVLWYIAALARDLGISMSTMAHRNAKKLQDRKERGVLGGSGDKR